MSSKGLASALAVGVIAAVGVAAVVHAVVSGDSDGGTEGRLASPAETSPRGTSLTATLAEEEFRESSITAIQRMAVAFKPSSCPACAKFHHQSFERAALSFPTMSSRRGYPEDRLGARAVSSEPRASEVTSRSGV